MERCLQLTTSTPPLPTTRLVGYNLTMTARSTRVRSAGWRLRKIQRATALSCISAKKRDTRFHERARHLQPRLFCSNEGLEQPHQAQDNCDTEQHCCPAHNGVCCRRSFEPIGVQIACGGKKTPHAKHREQTPESRKGDAQPLARPSRAHASATRQ